MSDTSSNDFIEFIKPFTLDKNVELIDVGAHKGNVLKEVIASGLNVVKAYLFEPNPDSFSVLRKQRNGLSSKALNDFVLRL